MKERPILFNGAMVRAILAGHKTVTRRPLKAQAFKEIGYGVQLGECFPLPDEGPAHPNDANGYYADLCPYGRPGDRLWVRETFMDLRGTGVEHRPDPCGPLQRYAYAAECPPGSFADETRKDMGLKWTPSIHMPREACRILLEVTAVRVERLQAITAEQALAEGVRRYERHAEVGDWFHVEGVGDTYCADPREAFARLWKATGGDWEANSWVWVVEFKRVQPEALAAGEAA